MHTESIVHSGLDSLSRPIRPGRYSVFNNGDSTTCLVTEDADTGQLGVVIHGQLYALSDVDPACVFSRMANVTEISANDASFVNNILARARRHREALARLEGALAKQLGCERGDGSPVWDGISAAVRDGMGTAVDLLDLAS